MSRTIIWHNPRCSKSRATLALLQEQGIEPEIVRYLESPPSIETLQQVLTILNMQPSELARKGEAEWQDLEQGNADEATILQALASHPRLIERPLVLHGDKAALGRPPEQILEIL